MRVSTEQVIVNFDGKHTATITKGTVGVVDMDENTPAVCDLCNELIGALKDVKHTYSPERFTRAILNGLLPEKILEAQLAWLNSKGRDIVAARKLLIDSWKAMAMDSETDWAVCSECSKRAEAHLETTPKPE